MVNRGRPSLDCLPCRRRKLRCDLQRDGCGQCRRANLDCFGYREPGQLIIRDETRHVEQKALLANYHHHHHHHHHHHCRPPPHSVVTHAASVHATTTVSMSLELGWDVRARAAFFAHYVFGISRSHDTLAPLLAAAPPRGALASAVDAASLAFLAHETSHDVTLQGLLSQLAGAAYVTAIRQLTSVIATADVRFGEQDGCGNDNDGDGEGGASSDIALQSALLLDLYEKLVFSTRTMTPPSCDATRGTESARRVSVMSDGEARGAWMSHARGALDLARVRGSRNFTSHIGRRLVTRLIATLVISSAAAGQRVPQQLEDLRANLNRHLDRRDAKWGMTDLVAQTINLLADVREGTTAGEAEVLRRAVEVDARFRALEQELSATWGYKRVRLPEGSEPEPLVYGTYYDLYPDHYITQVRNVMRIMRLILADMLLRRPALPDHDARSLSASVSLTSHIIDYLQLDVDQLTLDVCASVPQFIWPQACAGNRVPFTPMQMLQCYTVLAPLYLAAQVAIRADLRAWILRVVDFMAEQGGMRPAKTVADVLRQSPDVSYWRVYAMLGSYAFAA